MSNIEEVLVMSGTWIYADEIENEVHIIESNFKAGSGDYEDPTEIRDDEIGRFYGVRIGSLSTSQVKHGGDYLTIDEAKTYASTVCPSLIWTNELVGK